MAIGQIFQGYALARKFLYFSLAGKDVQVKATQQCDTVVNIPYSRFSDITQADILLGAVNLIISPRRVALFHCSVI